MGTVFFDVETTGLPKVWNAPYTCRDNWPRVIQLCFIVDSPEERQVYSSLCKTTAEIEPGATAAHGIDKQKLEKKGRDLLDVLRFFYSKCKNADLIVAHNAAFDVKTICNNMHELGMVEEAAAIYAINRFCTMVHMTPVMKLQFKRRSTKNYKFPKLSEVATYFKIDISRYNLHDAKSDTRILYTIFQRIAKMEKK